MKGKKVSIQIGENTLTIESGGLAKQAAGSAIVTLGETAVFSAVTRSKEPVEDIDYLPLHVEYRERFSAAGRLPAGFFKRETKPTEREILISRLTDRPIRSLLPNDYEYEIQIYNLLLSSDTQNDPDILSVLAANVALLISDIPYCEPIGCVRVGRVNGEFIINPSHSVREKCDLDLVYCATKDKVVMLEGEAQEIKEEDMISALKFAHPYCQELIKIQYELLKELNTPVKQPEPDSKENPYIKLVQEKIGEELKSVVVIPVKKEREKKFHELRKIFIAEIKTENPEISEGMLKKAIDKVESSIVKNMILNEGKRPDGRGYDDIRPMYAEVGVLKRVHGSAIFQRGETQALGTLTLGSRSESQELDAIAGGPEEKHFILHYNFPPFCVGEIGKIGTTSRREIGHGSLAERSLKAVLPKDYPYTIRLVSDIMESNGSSSMATVCVGSLALMDAGVPITKAVAGVSIGMVSTSDRYCLLTDITGMEDHCGDMDFKVAGTRDGITGIQVDLKIKGLTIELIEQIFEKARNARLKILDFMNTVISNPRPELSCYAPRFYKMKINPDKIGDLIGPAGKTIHRIIKLSNAQIDIEDDGVIYIFASDKNSLEIAKNEIEKITAEVEIGKIYTGTVTSVRDFGAFVEILPGKEGMVHISELANFRVPRVEDVCKVGDVMKVKCIGIDERGRVKLSRKQAMSDQERDLELQNLHNLPKNSHENNGYNPNKSRASFTQRRKKHYKKQF